MLEQLKAFWNSWKIVIILFVGVAAILLSLYWAGLGADLLTTYRDNAKLRVMHKEQADALKAAQARAEQAEKMLVIYQAQKGEANALKPVLEQINKELLDIKIDQESIKTQIVIQDEKRRSAQQQYLDDMRSLRR